MKKAIIAIVATVALVGVAASCGSEETTAPAPQKTAQGAEPKTDAEKEFEDTQEHNAEGQSQLGADILKGYATDKGSAAEQSAAEHVTKVQDDGRDDSLMPMADIYTDLTGDMFSTADANQAQLIVALYKGLAAEQGFATGDNSGLVTVYNGAGEMINNGNF